MFGTACLMFGTACMAMYDWHNLFDAWGSLYDNVCLGQPSCLRERVQEDNGVLDEALH